MGESPTLQGQRKDGSLFYCSIQLYHDREKGTVTAAVRETSAAAELINKQGRQLEQQNQKLQAKNNSLESELLNSNTTVIFWLFLLIAYLSALKVIAWWQAPVDPILPHLREVSNLIVTATFSYIAGAAHQKFKTSKP